MRRRNSSLAPDERSDIATRLLDITVASYAVKSITVERVMTGSGSPHVSKAFRAGCDHLRVRHLRSEPCTPRTDGKAEHFM